jgi:hypothetical protein
MKMGKQQNPKARMKAGHVKQLVVAISCIRRGLSARKAFRLPKQPERPTALAPLAEDTERPHPQLLTPEVISKPSRKKAWLVSELVDKMAVATVKLIASRRKPPPPLSIFPSFETGSTNC